MSVIDGLGHGGPAAEAAGLACDYLAVAPPDDLTYLLRGCHRRLQGTRGAAMAIARIDLAAQRVAYAGVGNIEARLIGRTTTRPISYNGIVGAVLPNFRVFDYPFGAGDWFIMHSDGISARFDLTHYPDLTDQPAQLLADALARDWARKHDDATIVVGRHTGD